jgi:AmmeMemoRadiSam system protein A
MLTHEEKRYLVDLARRTIESRLYGVKTPAREKNRETLGGELTRPCGAFVTLKREGKLRGCIGYVEARKPLVQTVEEMAICAAFEDPRFAPLTREEWDGVEIEISVMSPLERIQDPSQVEVGAHGILMKRGFNQGLLLPQVATEQGWNRKTFLQHTCFKAGMTGECWKDPDTQIFIFTADVFSEGSMS